MHHADILKKAALIKCVIFDVDGVLTDGRLYFDVEGREQKVFHVHDGMGIKLLQKAGITVAIISSRTSSIVTQRSQELGIQHVYQGQADKLIPFEQLISLLKLHDHEIAYVGDDLPDLPIIKRVGLGIAVANAVPTIQQASAWQTKIAGGHGAAREVCELILQATKK